MRESEVRSQEPEVRMSCTQRAGSGAALDRAERRGSGAVSGRAEGQSFGARRAGGARAPQRKLSGVIESEEAVAILADLRRKGRESAPTAASDLCKSKKNRQRNFPRLSAPENSPNFATSSEVRRQESEVGEPAACNGPADGSPDQRVLFKRAQQTGAARQARASG